MSTLAKSDKLSVWLNITLTENEYEQIVNASRSRGLNVNEYVRTILSTDGIQFRKRL